MLSIPSRVSSITLAPLDALNSRAAELRAEGRHVISIGQALPGFGPPPSAIAAAKAAYDGPESHIYSGDAGLEGLRVALCQRLAATANTQADLDDVIVTAGGNQAFMLAMLSLVDAAQEVVIPAPYFGNHEMTVRAIGAVPIEVPLREQNGFKVTWDEIEPNLTSRTRAVVVCSPGNPTGTVIEESELVCIQQELARLGMILVVDETYARFVYEGQHVSAASLPTWRENVIVVSTFSKSFGMSGWRVGYLLADRDVCEQAIKIQDATIICAPVISQIGAEATIREDWQYPLSFHPEIRARRQLLRDGLERIPRRHWTPTNGGFFAFVKVDGCSDFATLSNDILEKAHVVTIPGSAFGETGEGYVRLSYGSVSQKELREALARLERYFSV